MTALFSLVEEYAALGIHRSGTRTQAATAGWLATHLRERGGRVRLEPVEFDRYVADWSVAIDGDEVESLPLFYEATGQASTSTPATGPAFAPLGTGPMGVSGALDTDVEPGGLVVAATRHLTGLLAVSNRGTALGSGVHVLQVAAELGGALANAARESRSLLTSWSASRRPARSCSSGRWAMGSGRLAQLRFTSNTSTGSTRFSTSAPTWVATGPPTTPALRPTIR